MSPTCRHALALNKMTWHLSSDGQFIFIGPSQFRLMIFLHESHNSLTYLPSHDGKLLNLISGGFPLSSCFFSAAIIFAGNLVGAFNWPEGVYCITPSQYPSNCTKTHLKIKKINTIDISKGEKCLTQVSRSKPRCEVTCPEDITSPSSRICQLFFSSNLIQPWNISQGHTNFLPRK